jgi:hypothetical protein
MDIVSFSNTKQLARTVMGIYLGRDLGNHWLRGLFVRPHLGCGQGVPVTHQRLQCAALGHRCGFIREVHLYRRRRRFPVCITFLLRRSLRYRLLWLLTHRWCYGLLRGGSFLRPDAGRLVSVRNHHRPYQRGVCRFALLLFPQHDGSQQRRLLSLLRGGVGGTLLLFWRQVQ